MLVIIYKPSRIDKGLRNRKYGSVRYSPGKVLASKPASQRLNSGITRCKGKTNSHWSMLVHTLINEIKVDNIVGIY